MHYSCPKVKSRVRGYETLNCGCFIMLMLSRLKIQEEKKFIPFVSLFIPMPSTVPATYQGVLYT